MEVLLGWVVEERRVDLEDKESSTSVVLPTD